MEYRGKPKGAPSSYTWGIRAAFRGFDTSRRLKSMLSEMLFCSENVEIGTRIRDDNSCVVEHAHSTNSTEKDRRLNGFLESNREELQTNPWLSLSHIMGPLNISGEMTKQRPILS